MAEGQPASKRTRADEDGGQQSSDEVRWTEVFWMLHDGGQGDRGSHYALTIANLKKRAEDIDSQVEALRQAEGNLLRAACEEVLGKAQAEGREIDREQALTWGRALANAVEVQSTEAARMVLLDEPLDAPSRCSIEAQKSVQSDQEGDLRAREHSEAEANAQATAQAQAQAELALMAEQAEAMQQAQAIAEAHAQAVAAHEAQEAVQAMAEQEALIQQSEALMQAQQQQQSEAYMQALLLQQQQQQQEALKDPATAAAERAVLRAQGLNSKGLPMRPGVPACAFYSRRGECRYGRTCKWDHPEADINSKGYPMRPGETPCAFYLRTGTCKYSATCKFDHPEITDGSQVAALAASLKPTGFPTQQALQDHLRGVAASISEQHGEEQLSLEDQAFLQLQDANS